MKESPIVTTLMTLAGAIVFAAIDGTVRLPVAACDPAPAQTQSQSQSQPVQAG